MKKIYRKMDKSLSDIHAGLTQSKQKILLHKDFKTDQGLKNIAQEIENALGAVEEAFNYIPLK